MAMVREHAARVGFGLFEADLNTGELWKAGRRIKLQGQPFKVLTVLLEHSGEVVSREELHTLLWGKDSAGDFDHSLGTAINKIRDALGDTADNPRFVETLARRGYRWIAPVTVISAHPGDGEAVELAAAAGMSSGERAAAHPRHAGPKLQVVEPAATSHQPHPPQSLQPGWLVAAALAVMAILGWLLLPNRRIAPLLRIEQLTRTGKIAPGMPAMESLPASVTDGLRLYVPVLANGRSVLSVVDVHTGAVQPLSVPQEIESPMLGDISPDGSTMLLRSHLSPESEQPLWLVPTSGGSALRVGNVTGHDATWMPDGKSVLYGSGNQLIAIRLQDSNQTVFATLPGRAFWMRWSPDGKLLRFTLLDPIAHTMRLGEIGRDGKGLRTLLDGWNTPSSECCGVWTGDGRYFIFQSNRPGSHNSPTSDLWRLDGKSVSDPVRVTDGPMNYVAPVAPRIGDRIFFLGLETQSALQRYDPGLKQFVPESGFLANAARVEYTRDGRWVNWTDVDGKLFRAHADGTETIQLTPDSLQVFLAHWSPDGRRLALMAKEPGKAWQLYMVAADGGAPEPLLKETRNAADPSWSADGQQIVFGRVSDVMGKEESPRALEILDLRTRQVTTVPESQGLFSPRWSPDGRYIAALSLDQRKLLLFDTAARSWRTIAETTAADPVWSADGKSIYFHASLAEMQPIYRLPVPDGHPEQIANLANFVGGATADYFFCGLTPGDAPIIRARNGTGNLYSTDLEER